MGCANRVKSEISTRNSDAISIGNHSIWVVPWHHWSDWSVSHQWPHTHQCVCLPSWRASCGCDGHQLCQHWEWEIVSHTHLHSLLVSTLNNCTSSCWDNVQRVGWGHRHWTVVCSNICSLQWHQGENALVTETIFIWSSAIIYPSPWSNPCSVHHDCTVHWWVQCDITGQSDIAFYWSNLTWDDGHCRCWNWGGVKKTWNITMCTWWSLTLNNDISDYWGCWDAQCSYHRLAGVLSSMRGMEKVKGEDTIGYSDVISIGNHSIWVIPHHHRIEGKVS